jgi:circadian clock protein KaiC
MDLGRHARSGVLAMCSLRARADNPEAHVARIRALVRDHRARNLIVDPISALAQTGDPYLSDRAAVQVLDVAKGLGITTISTSLLANAAPLTEETPIGISTIADTWMHVSYVSKGGERNRALTIVKSRGTKHSNQVRELILTDAGVTLADTYLSGGEVLMGTLRWEKENEDRRARALALTESELRQKQAESALAETRARVEAARAELALREAALTRIRAVKEAEAIEHDRTLAERAMRRGGARRTSPRGRRSTRARS